MKNLQELLSAPRLLIAIACIPAIIVLSHIAGRFDPVPERADDESTVFLYYGPDGQTLPAGDGFVGYAAAEATLQETDYFGAYAVGSGGRIGLWTGARTLELARSYALAQCGDGCRVIAERVPLHRDPARTEQVLTRAMAENIGVRWSDAATNVLAVGGANAWGHSGRLGRKAGGRKRMLQIAGKDCDARRAAETAPAADISPPCRSMLMTEIVDLRPRPTLYPAPYTIDLTALSPAGKTKLVRRPDAPRNPFLSPIYPSRLYGTRAATPRTRGESVREAGWPEAGEALALRLCEAARRPHEVPCAVSHVRVPQRAAADGVLPVPSDVFEAYTAWQTTEGAGAFAISPFGVWGTSYDMPDRDAALQRAADWCLYYSRRTWVEHQFSRALIEPVLPCRIVAVRDR